MTITRIPENTGGEPYFRINEVQIMSWGPELDGKGPATELHILMTAQGCPYPIVQVMSLEEVDTFVASIREIRNAEWPHIPEGGPS